MQHHTKLDTLGHCPAQHSPLRPSWHSQAPGGLPPPLPVLCPRSHHPQGPSSCLSLLSLQRPARKVPPWPRGSCVGPSPHPRLHCLLLSCHPITQSQTSSRGCSCSSSTARSREDTCGGLSGLPSSSTRDTSLPSPFPETQEWPHTHRQG